MKVIILVRNHFSLFIPQPQLTRGGRRYFNFSVRILLCQNTLIKQCFLSVVQKYLKLVRNHYSLLIPLIAFGAKPVFLVHPPSTVISEFVAIFFGSNLLFPVYPPTTTDLSGEKYFNSSTRMFYA